MLSNLTTDLANIASIKQNQINIAKCTTQQKNQLLTDIYNNVNNDTNAILQANLHDVEIATKNNMPQNLIDRLMLNHDRINAALDGVKTVINLPDYVGQVIEERHNKENDLTFKRIRTPIGVIMMIYEARPLVAIDASILCLKSGNCLVLKPSKDSLHSSRAIFNAIQNALQKNNLQSCVLMLDPTNRDATLQAIKMDNIIDMIIPRGGRGLIEFISQNSTIPVLKHLDGNCHTYIHSQADLDRAIQVLLNAKLRRTSVCGATESLIIDEQIALEFLPKLSQLLEKNCQIYACKQSYNILLSAMPQFANLIHEASDDDFYTEYLDAKISVKIVANINDAITHINKYSSHHTDAIITQNQQAADEFCKLIDSAIVMHNTSTQFADGFEFGLGGEIGISTNKLHARGPVALEGLTTYKWSVCSNYITRK